MIIDRELKTLIVVLLFFRVLYRGTEKTCVNSQVSNSEHNMWFLRLYLTQKCLHQPESYKHEYYKSYRTLNTEININYTLFFYRERTYTGIVSKLSKKSRFEFSIKKHLFNVWAKFSWWNTSNNSRPEAPLLVIQLAIASFFLSSAPPDFCNFYCFQTFTHSG